MSADDIDDRLLDAIGSGTVPPDACDSELAGALALHEHLEALFGLLRKPPTLLRDDGDQTVRPGAQLGEFTILRQLGSGGMGSVFLARQESLERLVALKVCKPNIRSEQRFRERFAVEARAMAQLNHPQVAPVLLTGEQDGCLYIVMEYVPGPTFADVLQAVRCAPADMTASAVVKGILAYPEQRPMYENWSEGRATIDRGFRTWVVQTLEKVAEGLAAIHRAGIVHRDVKPANIVLDAKGEPKIVDFGLARVGHGPRTTAFGEFIGTPAYTSPEQARGVLVDISPASDVFSFGVMIFEFLSLRLPFVGSSSAEVLKSILADEAPLLRRVDKKVPWELEAIADKCLRKAPTDRYSSAAPLAEDLRNYLNLRPISARRATALRRVGRQLRRRPWVAAFAAAVVLATTLGAVIAFKARQDADRVDIERTLYRSLYGSEADLDGAVQKAKEYLGQHPDGSDEIFGDLACAYGQIYKRKRSVATSTAPELKRLREMAVENARKALQLNTSWNITFQNLYDAKEGVVDDDWAIFKQDGNDPDGEVRRFVEGLHPQRRQLPSEGSGS